MQKLTTRRLPNSSPRKTSLNSSSRDLIAGSRDLQLDPAVKPRDDELRDRRADEFRDRRNDELKERKHSDELRKKPRNNFCRSLFQFLVFSLFLSNYLVAFGQNLNQLQTLAKKGDPKAMMKIADAYAHGHGVPVSNYAALQWYRRAALTHYPPALLKMGEIYLSGEAGAQHKPKLGSRWIHRAATKGNARAQAIMGDLYSYGEGVHQNYAEAYAWYSVAIKNGLTRLHGKLKDVEYSIPEDELSLAFKKARKYKMKYYSRNTR